MLANHSMLLERLCFGGGGLSTPATVGDHSQREPSGV
jgi:hypothetical protein